MRPTVLLVTSRFPFGPKEAFLREEVAELERHCDVLVVPALPTRDALAVPALRDRTVRLPLLSIAVLSSAAREFMRAPRRALRALLAITSEPKSLHARLKNAAVFPTALAVTRFARERGATHAHGYWLSTPATIAFVVGKLNGIPWSATGHRYDLVDFNIRTLRDGHGGFLDRAQFVRVISSEGTERVRRALGSRGSVHTEHLGVRVPPAPAVPLERGVFELICAANLERVKGHPVLFEALALARKAGVRLRCTLAGDGTERERLESLARNLGIHDIVRFEGALSHTELLSRIESGAFDAAILTSIDEGPSECEGIPVSLMEAMAAGLPVIATRSGSVPELVDGSNGLLCDAGDSIAVARCVERLARDPALRRELGLRGRATVIERFDITRNARRIAQRFHGIWEAVS